MWDTLGWGGETQALVWHPGERRVIAVNALGVAPTGATPSYFRERQMRYPPEYGPLAAVTPLLGAHIGGTATANIWVTGALAVSSLGMWLVTSLLGMQVHETLEEAQQFDGVGEFANMVCGAWLSRLSDDCLFELRVPAVTRMTAGWTPLAETNARQELICRMVTINELPMRILIRAN